MIETANLKYGDMMLGKEYNGFTKTIFEEGKIYQ